MNCIARVLSVISATACFAAPAHAQSGTAPPDGRTVYLTHCAQCHEQVNERVPHREALQRLPSTRILRALDAGAMLAIAMTMHRDERVAVAAYLGTDAVDSGPSPAAFCADRSVRLAALRCIRESFHLGFVCGHELRLQRRWRSAENGTEPNAGAAGRASR
jgi:cytochrome c553